MSIELNENEVIEDLQFKNLKIIQNKKGFCFGIDSVLLSDFAKEIKDNSTVIDLGTRNRDYFDTFMWKNKIKENNRCRNSRRNI